MATPLVLYEVLYKRKFDGQPRDQEIFGIDLDIMYYPARTKDEVKTWFEQNGIERAKMGHMGATGAVIREIKEVHVPDYVVLALSKRELNLENRL